MENKLSLKDLMEIKKDMDNESKRYRLSIQLGYCPECGSILANEKKEKIEKKHLFSKGYKIWDVRLICSLCTFEEKYDYSTW